MYFFILIFLLLSLLFSIIIHLFIYFFAVLQNWKSIGCVKKWGSWSITDLRQLDSSAVFEHLELVSV